MPKHILFRVDASYKIGTGHVMRCLVLAEELLKKGCKVTFISCNMPLTLINKLENMKIQVIELSFDNHDSQFNMEEDASKTVKYIECCQPTADILVIDHYMVDERWEKKVRPYIETIAVIDDLANRRHECDWLLDQNYVKNMSVRYEGLVPSTCRLFLGPAYGLFRNEFHHQRRHVKVRTRVERVLVSFGGTDPTNETLRIIELLEEELLPSCIYNIVVGSLNPYKEVIKKKSSQLHNVNYYEDVTNMAELIVQADLCIGAAGISLWERSVLGLPSIIIVVADNQRDSASEVADTGLGWNLGWYSDVSGADIANIITSLKDNPTQLKLMSERLMEFIDISNRDGDDIHPFAKALLGGKGHA
ncbi:UDP-2,4-diacetamido-2,4,6-trideoxy-beta-L-altropyranose hydrolase [Paenibacillus marinisediminis]